MIHGAQNFSAVTCRKRRPPCVGGVGPPSAMTEIRRRALGQWTGATQGLCGPLPGETVGPLSAARLWSKTCRDFCRESQGATYRWVGSCPRNHAGFQGLCVGIAGSLPGSDPRGSTGCTIVFVLSVQRNVREHSGGSQSKPGPGLPGRPTHQRSASEARSAFGLLVRSVPQPRQSKRDHLPRRRRVRVCANQRGQHVRRWGQ